MRLPAIDDQLWSVVDVCCRVSVPAAGLPSLRSQLIILVGAAALSLVRQCHIYILWVALQVPEAQPLPLVAQSQGPCGATPGRRLR